MVENGFPRKIIFGYSVCGHYAEFICMECGRIYGHADPVRCPCGGLVYAVWQDDTPEGRRAVKKEVAKLKASPAARRKALLKAKGAPGFIT
jgi:hypothetical protein